jgi:predicted MarR family transcription regulator
LRQCLSTRVACDIYNKKLNLNHVKNIIKNVVIVPFIFCGRVKKLYVKHKICSEREEMAAPKRVAEKRSTLPDIFPENPLKLESYQGLDRKWHLARNDHEVAVAEFEYALIRTWEAFIRWQSECLAAITGLEMNGNDTAILHIIRLKDRPKGIKEIARLMNRDDLPNIQYSLRKLTQAKLIERAGAGNKRKGATYQVTEKGKIITEQYATLRGKLLIGFTSSVSKLEEDLTNASLTLDLMTGIYEQSSRIAATHRQPQE